jgi:hypothetical protein
LGYKFKSGFLDDIILKSFKREYKRTRKAFIKALSNSTNTIFFKAVYFKSILKQKEVFFDSNSDHNIEDYRRFSPRKYPFSIDLTSKLLPQPLAKLFPRPNKLTTSLNEFFPNNQTETNKQAQKGEILHYI